MVPVFEMSEAGRDDFELLDAWCEGDTQAGDALVRRYYGALLRFFELRVAAAEDLAQRTVLAIVEQRHRFRGDASFRTYLFSVARRVLIQQLKADEHAARMSQFDAPQSARRTSLSMLFARKQEQQLVLVALATLPEQAQTLLVLHYWERLTSREIAEVLDVPTSTVTTRLSRARRALATAVEALTVQGASTAVLDELDGWTRSLASMTEEAAGVDDLIARIQASLGLAPRTPG